MAKPVERRPWTELEASLLRQAVEQCQSQLQHLDWKIIANHVPGRNRKACRARWFQISSRQSQTGHWQQDEDERLAKAVSEHGKKWARVAQDVATRDGDQCLRRWSHSLDPDLDHRPWSEEDDRMLEDAVARHGSHWARIRAEKFPHRSALALRHRYQVLENRRKTGFQRLRDGPFLFLGVTEAQ